MAQWFLITREQLERRLRGVAYARAGLITAILIVSQILQREDRQYWFEVTPWHLNVVFTAAYLLCLVQLLGIRRRPYRSSTLIWLHVFIDICVVTGIVQLTGSLQSPFTFLYVATILSASVLLTQAATLLSAIFSTVVVGTLSILTYQGLLQKVSAIEDFAGDMHALTPAEFWSELGMLVLSFHVASFLGGYLSRSLRSERDIQDDIFQTLRTGLVAFDGRRKVTFMNRAAEEIFGTHADDVLGSGVEALMPCDQGQALAVAMEQGRPFTDQEVHLISGGKDRILEITTSTTRTPAQRHLALISDVTKVRELEERLKLQDRLSAIGEAAAGVAHEVRNPLATIRGAARALSSGGSLDHEEGRLAELIVQESDRLGRVVTTFLDFAKTSPPRPERVSLTDLLHTFQERWHKQTLSSEESAFVLKIELPDEDQYVKVDVEQICIVLDNLIRNAREAGATQAAVSCHSAEDQDQGIGRPMKLSVCDDGPGIPERNLDKIFQPFYTSRAEGTGMGLAIVDRIVASHGGKISICSEEGKGTTIMIHLLSVDEEGDTRA